MNNIDFLARTNSTAQIIHHYRRHDLIHQLESDLETCTKGMFLAIQHILCKGIIPIRHTIPDRIEMVDLDIIQEMRGQL